MSTHANILILGEPIKLNKRLSKQKIRSFENENVLYIHSDGYPSNILNWLLDFLKLNGAKFRSFDKYYLMSWLCTYFNVNIMTRYLNKNLDYSIFDKDYKEKKEKFINYEFKASDFNLLNDFRGSGIFKFNEIESDYLYIITPTTANPENLYKLDHLESYFNIYVLNYENKIIYALNENESKENINLME